MNKDLIKWGLILVAAYLVYKYVEEQGGIDALFGGAPKNYPLPPASTTTSTDSHGATTAAPHDTPTTDHPGAQTQAPPATLDMTGLKVARDVNDSLAGTVKINGVPTRLAIITADGRIFNDAGQEVTASLASQGIDVNALRGAFQAAGANLAGLNALDGRRYVSPYLM